MILESSSHPLRRATSEEGPFLLFLLRGNPRINDLPDW
jgi:hypothetical protein